MVYVKRGDATATACKQMDQRHTIGATRNADRKWFGRIIKTANRHQLAEFFSLKGPRFLTAHGVAPAQEQPSRCRSL